MFELKKNEHINELIKITKSSSGVSGPILAKTHMELGGLLARQMREKLNIDWTDTTVVAIMRGGIFFAEGMYLETGSKFMTYDPHNKDIVFERPNTKNVIIVDAVINTGETIKSILQDDMYIACCVINKKALAQFEDRLCVVRVSDNSYVGEAISKQLGNKGPDTTMRLYNLI